MDSFQKRDIYCGYGQYYSNGRCYNQGAWYYWGRWVFAGVVVLFVLLVLAMLGCISSRRRRRRGMAPMYGTGWMTNNTAKYGPPPPGVNNEMYPQGPPAYNQQPQYTGTTFNPNDGYYGNQQNGVQYPQNSYSRDQVYAPPTGPPPAKA